MIRYVRVKRVSRSKYGRYFATVGLEKLKIRPVSRAEALHVLQSLCRSLSIVRDMAFVSNN